MFDPREALGTVLEFAGTTTDPERCTTMLRVIAHLRRVLDGAEAAILAAQHDGRTSSPGQVTAGLRSATGMSASEARRRATNAAALTAFPALGDALRSGDVSFAHAEAVTKAAAESQEATAALSGAEDALITAAKSMAADDYAKHVGTIVAAASSESSDAARAARQHRNRKLSAFPGDDGMQVIRTELPPVEGQEVVGTICHIARELWRSQSTAGAGGGGGGGGGRGPEPTDLVLTSSRRYTQLMADALVVMARRSIHGTWQNATASATASTAAPVVLIDWQTLFDELHPGTKAQLANGTPIPAATLRRLACEAGIIPAVLGSRGEILDLGIKARFASPAQRKALAIMWGGCAYPGCTAPAHYTQAHHITPYRPPYGPTDLINLVPLCTSHHHLIHDGGVTVTQPEPGHLIFTTPTGTVLHAWAKHPAPAPATRTTPPRTTCQPDESAKTRHSTRSPKPAATVPSGQSAPESSFPATIASWGPSQSASCGYSTPPASITIAQVTPPRSSDSAVRAWRRIVVTRRGVAWPRSGARIANDARPGTVPRVHADAGAITGARAVPRAGTAAGERGHDQEEEHHANEKTDRHETSQPRHSGRDLSEIKVVIEIRLVVLVIPRRPPTVTSGRPMGGRPAGRRRAGRSPRSGGRRSRGGGTRTRRGGHRSGRDLLEPLVVGGLAVRIAEHRPRLVDLAHHPLGPSLLRRRRAHVMVRVKVSSHGEIGGTNGSCVRRAAHAEGRVVVLDRRRHARASSHASSDNYSPGALCPMDRWRDDGSPGGHHGGRGTGLDRGRPSPRSTARLGQPFRCPAAHDSGRLAAPSPSPSPDSTGRVDIKLAVTTGQHDRTVDPGRPGDLGLGSCGAGCAGCELGHGHARAALDGLARNTAGSARRLAHSTARHDRAAHDCLASGRAPHDCVASGCAADTLARGVADGASVRAIATAGSSRPGSRSRVGLVVGVATVVVAALLGGLLYAARSGGDDSAIDRIDDALGSSDRDTDDDEGAGPGEDRETSDSGSDTETDVEPDSSEPLPIDDAVLVGTLDNGLTYYIRHNERPGDRVQLRLAVDAGSALEDPDQLGVAHFLEHMLFNGTEAYPENELISTLESFGSQFGADVNAYTSYDETVYQLGITDNDDDLVATAVDVLAQWAGHATIDPAQVEAERGVVIEEWRLRDLGLDSRLLQTYEDMLLGASPYGDREPIGVIEQLETMDAERVRRYYERWYRPDLMAVVVVGDVEVDVVEDLIEAAFGGLANPAEPANRPEPRVDPEAVERYVVSTDPEQTDGVAEIMFPGAFPQADTEAGVARTIADGIVLDAMAARLSADATRSVAPYRSTYPSGNAFVRDFDAPSFVVEADTAAIADSVNHVLVEIDRLRQHSLSEQELQRGIDSYTTGYEQAYRERETIQDLDFADRYVAHFLTGAAIPSENDRYNLGSRLLRNLEADDITASIDRLFGVDPAIVVFGPEADAALLPTADALAALVAASTGVTLEPRPDDAELGELMAAPEPVDVIEERNIVGFTNEPGRALTLANGVQVILYPTNISDDSITLVSSSPGGFSVIPDAWVAEAGLLTDIMFESGVGALDATALEQTLSDRFAYVEPTLTDVNEGFYGSSSTSDLETMLQLVHLYSTAPRIDDRAVETVVDDYRSIYGDLDTDPALAAQFALYSARYGADSRHRQVYVGPTSAELDTVTVEDAQALMADRFGDATGSVFALVGAFDMDEAEDLARRYLGTLPTGREETFADVEAAAPPG